jgi:hypothetical protein
MIHTTTQEAATHEAVGVFDDLEQLDKAVSELEGSQFARHDITVLGNMQEVEKRFGAKAVRPEWLEDNPRTPREISVRPEEKTIGATVGIGVLAYLGGSIGALMVNPATNYILLGSVALGSLLGAALGCAIVFSIRKKLSNRVQQQMREGGLLLWVKTLDRNRETIATNVLRKHGGKHVHISKTA